MAFTRIILCAALPGLMLGIIPAAGGTDIRFSWQLVTIWLAGAVFCAWLTSWWLRLLFVCCLYQVIIQGPIITTYMQLVMVGIFLAATQGYSQLDDDLVMDCICGAAIFLSTWGFLQHFGLVSQSSLGGSGYGPYNVNAASAVIAMTLPAFLRRGPGLIQPHFLVLVPLAGLAACRSTTGIIAALAGLMVYAGLSKITRRDFLLACLCVLIGAWALLHQVDPISKLHENPRWHAWSRIVQFYDAAPWGRGLGSFADTFPVMTCGDPQMYQPGNPIWHHAHNEYLQVRFELGRQAAILLAAFLGCMAVVPLRFRRLLSHNDRLVYAGFATTAVAAAGFYTFHVAPVALIGCAWIGLALKRPSLAKYQALRWADANLWPDRQSQNGGLVGRNGGEIRA